MQAKIIPCSTLLIATLPFAASSDVVTATARTEAQTSAIASGESGATLYTHNDCVGPLAPATAPADVTHTTTVGGLRFGPRLRHLRHAWHLPDHREHAVPAPGLHRHVAPCSGIFGNGFWIDVTIQISNANALGLSTPPTAGVKLTISQ